MNSSEPTNQECRVTDLLRSLFSTDELRNFVQKLSQGKKVLDGLPPNLPPTELVGQVCESLTRHGVLPDNSFFDGLVIERPHRTRDIELVRAKALPTPRAVLIVAADEGQRGISAIRELERHLGRDQITSRIVDPRVLASAKSPSCLFGGGEGSAVLLVCTPKMKKQLLSAEGGSFGLGREPDWFEALRDRIIPILVDGDVNSSVLISHRTSLVVDLTKPELFEQFYATLRDELKETRCEPGRPAGHHGPKRFRPSDSGLTVLSVPSTAELPRIPALDRTKVGQRDVHALLVDDDALVVRAFERNLRGLNVEAAVGGEAALRLLESLRFDILLTDIEMPGVDGIQVIEYARRFAPQLPVIAFSGWLTPQVYTALGRKDDIVVLEKPVSPRTLSREIGMLVDSMRTSSWPRPSSQAADKAQR